MKSSEIYIIGAGTYGVVMKELAEILNYKVIGFLDDDLNKKGSFLDGVEVVGSFSEFNVNDIENVNFIVAIGNNYIRSNLMSKIIKLGGNLPTLIHPRATISPSSKIGKGVYVHANSCIWTDVELSDYTIISPNTVIAHHTKIGKGCFVANQSAVGASVVVEDKVFIGMGATIVTGVKKIGKNTIIGAGATLITNAEESSVYVGVPAKKIRDIEK